jgi:hypothetical protein
VLLLWLAAATRAVLLLWLAAAATGALACRL